MGGAGSSNLPQNGGLINGPQSNQRTLPIRPQDSHGFDEYDNQDFQGGHFRHQSNFGY